MSLTRKFHDYVQMRIFSGYPKIYDVEIHDSLDIRDLNDGEKWQLLGSMTIRVLISRAPNQLPFWIQGEIPVNFITDLASVDNIPLVKIKKTTVGNRWYVAHDWGYQLNEFRLSQKSWDTIMLMGLKKDGASSGIAWRRWIGVQIGGRSTWNQYRGRK